MPRGQPDYGMYAVKEVTASISDMGEVAARLGSIVTFDKRGDVVDFDNFEEPVLRWRIDFDVAAGLAFHRTVNSLSGSQSLWLQTAAAAAAGERIISGINILGSRKLGMEFSFSNLSLNVNLYCWIRYYNGTNEYTATFRLNPTSLELDIQDHVTGWENIYTFPSLVAAQFAWYTIKLVADFRTGKYKRLLMANQDRDISAYTIPVAGLGIAPQIGREIGLVTRDGAIGSVYIDNFVFTMEEP